MISSPPSVVVSRELTSADPRFAAVLDGVVDRLAVIDGIVAVAVSGSVAAGDADPYSDLDLQCVFAEVTSDIAEAVRGAVHAVINVGDERWTAPNHILSTVSVDWIRLDVSLLDGRWPLSADSIIVLCTDGDGRDLPRGQHPIFAPDPSALQANVTKFLRSLGLMVRDLERGDLRLGCWATEFLIEELVGLMYWEQGIVRGAQKGTYRQLPDTDVQVLQDLPVASPERDSIIDGHLAVAAEYLTRARRLADAWDVSWPSAMEEGTSAFLAATLGRTFSSVSPAVSAKSPR